jgi:hypothetical protein
VQENYRNGAKFCWQHSHGVRAKLRSLTRNQEITFGLTAIGVLATLWFGISPIVFAKEALAEVRVDDNTGRGLVYLPPSSTTNLMFDQRSNMPTEVVFWVRDIGNDDLRKLVYAVTTSPASICRDVLYPQFGLIDPNGCAAATNASITPDLLPLTAVRRPAKISPPTNTSLRMPIATLSTNTDSFRQIKVRLNLPQDLNGFTVQFRLSAQNVSSSIYAIHFVVLR